MIPEPKHKFIDTGHEFVIAMGANKMREFFPIVDGMNIVDSRKLIPESYRAIQEAITDRSEYIAVGDGFLVRNPDERHKDLPFVSCSFYEATVWTFLSLTWGMEFAYNMFLTRYPVSRQRKWATCSWCCCRFEEFADGLMLDGVCSYQCYDQEYESLREELG